jgi:hypothetical protein
MDIGNILNAKGNAAAAAEARRQQQLAQSTPMSNRSNSDVGSEQESTASLPQPLHPSSNTPNKYPSPIPTAPNMQMMPSGFQADVLQENGYPPSDDVNVARPTSDQDKKSFACSHCSKGFARRSDLARHGKFRPLLTSGSQLILLRTNPQWRTPPRLRLAWLWQTVHPEVSPDSTCSCTYGRETSYVREMWKGVYISYTLRFFLALTPSSSLSAILVLWLGIDEFILASDHTNVLMPTARRRLRVAPL